MIAATRPPGLGVSAIALGAHPPPSTAASALPVVGPIAAKRSVTPSCGEQSSHAAQLCWAAATPLGLEETIMKKICKKKKKKMRKKKHLDVKNAKKPVTLAT